ncbi:MAG: GPW/gp25 family protein [Candidatus Izemoplasma sp.]
MAKNNLSKFFRTRFKDTDLNLNLNPLTLDFANLSHLDSVKKRVKTLVQTKLYDRPYQPALGSQVEGMLFEFGSFTTLKLIQEMIVDLILEFEPAIDSVSVSVTEMIPGPGMRIFVQFRVIEIQQEATLEIIHNRVR